MKKEQPWRRVVCLAVPGQCVVFDQTGFIFHAGCALEKSFTTSAFASAHCLR